MEARDIYIGRGYQDLTRSTWCNPFKCSDHERQEAISKFRSQLANQIPLLHALPGLGEARLRCHCHRNEACHADALIEAYKEFLASNQLPPPRRPPDTPKPGQG